MNKFVSEAGAASLSDDDCLPFEPIDAFSTDPVSFTEMSERMMGKVENLFDLPRLYNRHSAKYLKACGLLERGIKRLGSLCVTKYALEENDEVRYPELKQLTTQKLYRMASFNYRKLDTALTEKLEKGNDLYPELTAMVFSYFHLLQRLRATERNIHNYFDKRYYGKRNYGPIIEGKAFSGKSWTKHYTSEKEEAPVFRAAPAFPIRNSEFRIQNLSNSECGMRNSEMCLPELPAAADPAPVSEAKEPEAEKASVSEIIEGKTGDGSNSESGIRNSEMGLAEPEIPVWFEVIQNAACRGGPPEDGIAFTKQEVRILAGYPEIGEVFPDLWEAVCEIRNQK